MKPTAYARILLPLGGALALAACGAEEEEVTYEADAEDLSGGELQMADPDAEGVEVELPETEMTSASQEEIDAAHAEDDAAE